MKSKIVNGERLYYLANGSLVKRSQHPYAMEQRKKRYHANKEEERANYKEWYYNPKNHEKARAKQHTWRVQNKEKKRKMDLAYVNSERGYIMGLWHGIKKVRRGVLTNLTREIFFKFCYDHKEKMGGWLSTYSGHQMTMQRSIGLEKKKDGEKRKTRPTNMSVDRLDNSKIYMLDNIVLCTWSENRQKGDMSINLMRRVLELVDNK